MRICSQVNQLLPCGKWLTISLRVIWKLFLSFSLYSISLLNLIIIHLKSEDVLTLDIWSYTILSVYKTWRWLKVGVSVDQMCIVKFYVIELFHYIFILLILFISNYFPFILGNIWPIFYFSFPQFLPYNYCQVFFFD